MKGDAFTGPVMSSVILYVNAKDLKDVSKPVYLLLMCSLREFYLYH